MLFWVPLQLSDPKLETCNRSPRCYQTHWQTGLCAADYLELRGDVWAAHVPCGFRAHVPPHSSLVSVPISFRWECWCPWWPVGVGSPTGGGAIWGGARAGLPVGVHRAEGLCKQEAGSSPQSKNKKYVLTLKERMKAYQRF